MAKKKSAQVLTFGTSDSNNWLGVNKVGSSTKLSELSGLTTDFNVIADANKTYDKRTQKIKLDNDSGATHEFYVTQKEADKPSIFQVTSTVHIVNNSNSDLDRLIFGLSLFLTDGTKSYIPSIFTASGSSVSASGGTKDVTTIQLFDMKSYMNGIDKNNILIKALGLFRHEAVLPNYSFNCAFSDVQISGTSIYKPTPITELWTNQDNTETYTNGKILLNNSLLTCGFHAKSGSTEFGYGFQYWPSSTSGEQLKFLDVCVENLSQSRYEIKFDFTVTITDAVTVTVSSGGTQQGESGHTIDTVDLTYGIGKEGKAYNGVVTHNGLWVSMVKDENDANNNNLLYAYSAISPTIEDIGIWYSDSVKVVVENAYDFSPDKNWNTLEDYTYMGKYGSGRTYTYAGQTYYYNHGPSDMQAATAYHNKYDFANRFPDIFKDGAYDIAHTASAHTTNSYACINKSATTEIYHYYNGLKTYIHQYTYPSYLPRIDKNQSTYLDHIEVGFYMSGTIYPYSYQVTESELSEYNATKIKIPVVYGIMKTPKDSDGPDSSHVISLEGFVIESATTTIEFDGWFTATGNDDDEEHPVRGQEDGYVTIDIDNLPTFEERFELTYDRNPSGGHQYTIDELSIRGISYFVIFSGGTTNKTTQSIAKATGFNVTENTDGDKFVVSPSGYTDSNLNGLVGDISVAHSVSDVSGSTYWTEADKKIIEELAKDEEAIKHGEIYTGTTIVNIE